MLNCSKCAGASGQKGKLHQVPCCTRIVFLILAATKPTRARPIMNSLKPDKLTGKSTFYSQELIADRAVRDLLAPRRGKWKWGDWG